ncbi:MAG: DUF2510 domain-containing protein [Actinomycetota bacterium]
MDGVALPIRGWYSDPAGSGSLRWWDGFAWTDHLLDPGDPPAAQQPVHVAQPAYVPMQSSMQYGTRREPTVERTPTATATTAIWILALYPFFYYAAVWAIIAATNAIAPVPLGILILVAFVLVWAMALWDHSALEARGIRASSVLWMLLSPIGYLIARRMRLKKLGIKADAPGNVFVISLLAGVGLAFVVAPPIVEHAADTASITAFQTQISAALDQQTGTTWTVACPQDAPVETVNAVFTCHATDPAGRAVDIQATVASVRRFTVKLFPSTTGTTNGQTVS